MNVDSQTYLSISKKGLGLFILYNALCCNFWHLLRWANEYFLVGPCFSTKLNEDQLCISQANLDSRMTRNTFANVDPFHIYIT